LEFELKIELEKWWKSAVEKRRKRAANGLLFAARNHCHLAAHNPDGKQIKLATNFCCPLFSFSCSVHLSASLSGRQHFCVATQSQIQVNSQQKAHSLPICFHFSSTLGPFCPKFGPSLLSYSTHSLWPSQLCTILHQFSLFCAPHNAPFPPRARP